MIYNPFISEPLKPPKKTKSKHRNAKMTKYRKRAKSQERYLDYIRT